MAATPVVNITIPQATDFSQTITKENPDGTPVNLTGFSATATLKKFAESKVPISFSVGITSLTGQVSIGLTVGQTTPLRPGRYVYDIMLTSPAGVVTRMVQGDALLTPGVTTSI